MAARPLLPSSRTAMKALIGILLAAALAFASGCAKTDWIDRTLVTVDVTGVWTGAATGSDGGAGVLQFELEQQGSTVKGFVRGAVRRISAWPTTDVGPIEAIVAGDVFRFKDLRGNIEGELKVSGDEMDGRLSFAGGSLPFSLRRVDPSPRPASPPR